MDMQQTLAKGGTDMAQEEIKCGKCGTWNWVNPFVTTSCKKCGSPIRGTKAHIERSEGGSTFLQGYDTLFRSLVLASPTRWITALLAVGIRYPSA
jgi:hypothetical protein